MHPVALRVGAAVQCDGARTVTRQARHGRRWRGADFMEVPFTTSATRHFHVLITFIFHPTSAEVQSSRTNTRHPAPRVCVLPLPLARVSPVFKTPRASLPGGSAGLCVCLATAARRADGCCHTRPGAVTGRVRAKRPPFCAACQRLRLLPIALAGACAGLRSLTARSALLPDSSRSPCKRKAGCIYRTLVLLWACCAMHAKS